MKAKEWAAKLSESTEDMSETLKAFVEEIGSVARQRGGSPAAVEGAVREQRAKWLAVCRECPAVNPGMFDGLLETYGPDYKKAEEVVRAQAAPRGEPEGAGGALGGRRFGSTGKGSGRGRPR